MCKTFSAIGMKNGDLHFYPSIDSHEDIINIVGLNDNGITKKFVRIEYVPKDNDYSNLDSYVLTIDEKNVNSIEWLTDDLQGIWINKMRSVISRLIIDTNKYCLFDNTYILKGNIEICKLFNSRIINAVSATIEYAGSATIENADYATIKNANYATIKHADSATIKNADSATIKHADYATIENADYATILNK